MNHLFLKRLLPLACGAALFVTGCVSHESAQAEKPMAPAVKAEVKKNKNVLKGKILGKSNKAKTISISVGKGPKAKTVMVKFDANTKGVEHAVKGHASIIQFKGEGKDRIATVIKPKLAKLPKGTSEMKPGELAALLKTGKKVVVVDARPAKRFHEGSIAGAINIPVSLMKKKGAEFLPVNKDIPLVFFCGGPT